jgi:phenylalanyl-tRNA synthetase beta chain
MKISLQWLKKYVALEQSPEEIEKALTLLGFEVEEVIRRGLPQLPGVVVGEVLEREQHPNADRLSVCKVDVGDGQVRQIVCGAQNYKVGDRVPVALVGATLPGDFTIKAAKLRGVPSEGMMCSGREIGAGEDGAGLLILEQRPPLGQPINQVFPDGDWIFDLEITPNRADCLSHLGIARELAAYFDLDLKYPNTRYEGHPTSADHFRGLLERVKVENDEHCPLYLAHVICDVKVGPSPDWLRQALEAVGQRSINNIVDVTNYVMLELGQPLHAFDATKLEGAEIRVRFANEGEKIATLDGKERTLSARMLVIADAQQPVAIAGVMGGAGSEVDEATTDLVLEAAYFRPATVRWTSKRLGLSSDSSYRFERGVDSTGVSFAARRAIDLILETAGGKLCDPVFKIGNERSWKNEIEIQPDYIRTRCGFDIPNADLRRSLESLELMVIRENDGERGLTWTVEVPGFRNDLDRPIDLVEEVLRIHGTDKIPGGRVVAAGLVAVDDPVTEFNRAAGSYLVGQRFHECVNYTLRAKSELDWRAHSLGDELALANPLSEDQTHLRHSLLHGLLETLKFNQARGTGARHLFELGRTFTEHEGQVFEKVSVAFLISLDERNRSWLNRAGEDFYLAKSHVQCIAQLAGIDLEKLGVRAVNESNLSWQAGHSAEARGNGVTARFGLVSLPMLRALDISGTVLAGLMDIRPELLAKPRPRVRFQPFSLFPAALRDLAVIADETAAVGEIGERLRAISAEAAGSQFAVEGVQAFDVYQGKGLPEGKKSVAFSIAFRASDRTLTDDEVNAAFVKIQQGIETAGYPVRK